MKFRLPICLMISSLMFGCATRQAQYVDPQSRASISTDLNLADFDRMCRDLLKKMAGNSRLNASLKKGGAAFIGGIENRTYDHLDTQAFAENLKRLLLNSGNWTMIEPKRIDDILDRWELRKTGLFDKETAMKVGKLTDAQFMFTGAVTSSFQRQGRRTDATYQLTLELMSLDDGQLVWVEQTSVRKQFKRALVGQ